MSTTLRFLPPAETKALRAAVLRTGPLRDLPLGGDEVHGTLALGAFAAAGDGTDKLVGCCLLVPEPAPAEIGVHGPAWRLRGMAVLPAYRGGTGTALLARALEIAAQGGGEVVWCHARVPARRLYERAGFVALGGEFSEIGLPHLLMWRLLGPPGPDAREP